MTKVLLTIILLLITSAEAAAWVELRWAACASDGGSAKIQAGCDAAVTHDLVATFRTPGDLTIGCFYRLEARIDFELAGSPSLPLPFWMTEFGGCNEGAMSVSRNIQKVPSGCSASSSWDTTAGSSGIVGYEYPYFTNDRGVIGIFVERSSVLDTVTLKGDRDHYAFHLSIRTANAGRCPGCDQHVTFTLTSATLRSFCYGDLPILDPGPRGAAVTWNGVPTPVQNVTWGRLKQMYR